MVNFYLEIGYTGFHVNARIEWMRAKGPGQKDVLKPGVFFEHRTCHVSWVDPI